MNASFPGQAPQDSFVQAKALFQEGRLDEAVILTKDLLKFNPDRWNDFINLGSDMIRESRMDAAEAIGRLGVSLAPDNASIHNLLGAVLALSGRLNVALTEFERAVNLDPTDAMSWANWAKALMQSGQWNQASGVLDRALMTVPAEGRPILQDLVKVCAGHNRAAETSTPAPAACPLCGAGAGDPLKRFSQFGFFHCRACNLGFLHPRPSEEFLRSWYSHEAKLKRWNNDLMAAIAQNHEQNRFNNQMYLDFAREQLNLSGTKKVLDIGCYTGELLFEFKKMGHECLGLDMNEGLLEYGRQNFGLNLVCGDVRDFSFPPNHFDIIMFHQVLEHLPDVRAFLVEVGRILRPDGAIFFSVPNTGALVFELEKQLSGVNWFEGFLDIPNHLYYFSKTAIHRLLGDSGFRIRTDRTYCGPEWKSKYLQKKDCDEAALVKSRDILTAGSAPQRDTALKEHMNKVILSNLIEEAAHLAEAWDERPGLMVIAEPSGQTSGLGM